MTRKSGYLGRKAVQEKLKNRKRGALCLAVEQGLLGSEERLLASAQGGGHQDPRWKLAESRVPPVEEKRPLVIG